MFGSLLLDPILFARILARWPESVEQPDRRAFGLDAALGARGPQALRWSARTLSPFAVLSTARPVGALDPAAADILLIPPDSGGFAFLLRDMVATLAAARAAHVLEWINARRIPAGAGRFDIDDQAATIAAAAPEDAHWIAVCQSGPAALLAAARQAEGGRGPRSVTVIGAPIDVAAAPSVLSETIRRFDRQLYEDLVIASPAAVGQPARLVYPAEAQRASVFALLAAQSPDRHEFARLVAADAHSTPARPSFLERVTSLMDLPAELFLGSLDRIYLAPDGPCLGLRLEGRPVDPRALEATPVLVLEGERDAIAAPGQGRAALTLFPGGPGALRRAHLLRHVGHFGLIAADGWREGGARVVGAFLDEVDGRAAAKAGAGRSAG